MSTTAIASPVYWPENGHYYELVRVETNWFDALQAAASRSYLGLNGQLATIGSGAENLFLTDTFGANDALDGIFLGGFQFGGPEPDGGWYWVTGSTLTLTDPFTFTNWAPPPNQEPNNAGGNESVIEFAHLPYTIYGKTWNDLNPFEVRRGYLVEYAPEPSTGLLTFSAVTLLAIGHRRRKRG
ncbi:MAG: PEP-CTERM sorting domain-containing protein [Bryobacteraceae bacterium]